MTVSIIMGGPSSERDVSIHTGNEIMKYINNDYYDVNPILFDDKQQLIDQLKGTEFAFLALHGAYGEDGVIQGTLESLGIPYSGSGLLSSALCMHKAKAKMLMEHQGIPTPNWQLLTSDKYYWVDRNRIKVDLPLVIKPNASGSSIGTSLVKTTDQFEAALKQAFHYDHQVLLEEYIDGLEITCCVLGGTLLPILSIQPEHQFFDYTSKYEEGGALEEVITLPTSLHTKVEETALACYHLFECKAYARVDMLIRDDELFVLEVNTLPGMTKNSLFPKSAEAQGLSFTELIDQIIQLSLAPCC
ncbi:D-alanine--D-alanine ligase [Vallitalea okinawensis]|uniref:D-alanine--D-alanine ligase n=1 Tax=Vallitalea okinawensis TaxID=2078660 RepID=UPI000CFC9816|nr:D-alanine--D-alanine ligase [Vallitalea okinawensis]